ncbi:hypothetical protein [Litchfieldia alkalitelluris]|uniref:hypothetical protein n=1 Tax=Litchfieldia alkalitelluris TaxID=304268 RepID=UPI000995F906|nr:hypothetical protein [Litchfieldia alkalitelluris]
MKHKEFKRILDEEVFSQNPYNTYTERWLKASLDKTSKKGPSRFRLVYHSLLTFCVCFGLIWGTFLFLNDEKENNQETIQAPLAEEVEPIQEDEISDLALGILTDAEALEAFRELPKGIQNKFSEYLLHKYNEDHNVREKIEIAITLTKPLSKYKLEAMADRIPHNNFVSVFNDHGEKVYIVGEEWKSMANEFKSIDTATQQELIRGLQKIGREFVINNGEFEQVNEQSKFKPEAHQPQHTNRLLNLLEQDSSDKSEGLSSLLPMIEGKSPLLYQKMTGFYNSYRDIAVDEDQPILDDYLAASYDFFIFSYMIIQPKPVEVFAEPQYISNEEQVKLIIENYPR